MKILVIGSGVAAAALLLAGSASAQSFRPAVEPTVKSVRAAYPLQVMADQVGDMLNAIAWQHRPNIKLLKKGGGGRCQAPQGVDISCDILIWAPPGTPADQTVHVDVFGGASGDGLVAATARWQAHGPCTKRPAGHPQGGSGCELKNALDPIAPAGAVDPVPPSAPPAQVEAIVKLQATVDALNQALAGFIASTHGRFDALELQVIPTLTGIGQQLQEHAENAPPAPPVVIPCLRGRVIGQSVTLCPVTP